MLKEFFNKTNIINLLCFIVTAFIMYSFLQPLLKLCTPFAESLFMPYISFIPNVGNASIWQVFTASDHCWIIWSPIYVLTNRYMPSLLNMHPVTYFETVNSTIILCVFALFMYAINNNFFKYFKSQIFKPLFILALFPVVLTFLTSTELQTIFCWDCWFWAYIFLPMFPLILISTAEYFYVKGENPSKHQIIVGAILLLLTAVGHEFFRFMLVSSLFIGFCLHKFFINRNLGFKKFLPAFLGITFINVLIFATRSWSEWFTKRTRIDIIQIIPEYLQNFYTYILKDNAFLIGLVIAAFLAVTFLVKNESKKRLFVCETSIIISLVAFLLLIIIGQDTFQIMLQHLGVRFLTKITLFSVFLSLMGFLIANLCETKEKVVALAATIITFFPLCSLRAFFFLDSTFYIENVRSKLYMIEKAFLLNGQKNRTLYNFCPNDGAFNDQLIYYLVNNYNKGDNVNEYTIKHSNKEDDEFISRSESMRKFLEKEANVTFTDEELEHPDFEMLRKIYLEQ